MIGIGRPGLLGARRSQCTAPSVWVIDRPTQVNDPPSTDIAKTGSMWPVFCLAPESLLEEGFLIAQAPWADGTDRSQREGRNGLRSRVVRRPTKEPVNGRLSSTIYEEKEKTFEHICVEKLAKRRLEFVTFGNSRTTALDARASTHELTSLAVRFFLSINLDKMLPILVQKRPRRPQHFPDLSSIKWSDASQQTWNGSIPQVPNRQKHCFCKNGPFRLVH